MDKQQRVSISDIAEFCGVGTTTVSRVINHRGEVAKATRERVEEAIRQLGYVPSTAAQCMAQGQPFKQPNSRTIAVVDLPENSTTVAHAEIVSALVKEASGTGYRTIITEPVSNLDSEPFDGLLLLNDIRVKSDKPQVTVDWFSTEQAIPGVLPDYENGVFMAMDHALGKDYCNPLLLGGGDSDTDGSKSFNSLLRKGFIKALDHHGIKQEGKIYPSPVFTKETAYSITKDILKNSDVPDLIMTCDDVAVGVYRAAREAGITIGEELGVIGCDGISLTPFMHPSLATIDIDFNRLAKESIKRLIAMINNSPGPYPQQLLMPIEFVTGDSIR
jgi:LacI family transcriptional regulator, repressor for deo operon, udp, cdd, tsx, nupC, and nupG